MEQIRQLLVAERARRTEVERQLSEARATIAALQMQLASVRRPGQIISDCSELSGGLTTTRTANASIVGAVVPTSKSKKSNNNNSPNVGNGGVRKKKSKERTPKVKIPGQSRYWTPEEHKLFLEALRKFGHKDLRNISAYVGTRNMTQCRTHSQKYFMRLMREAKRQNPAIIAASAACSTPATTTSAAAAATAASTTAPASENGTTDGDNDSAADSNGMTIASNTQNSSGDAKRNSTMAENEANSDKYSVPNTCGMTLLCLVGQDTLTN